MKRYLRYFFTIILFTGFIGFKATAQISGTRSIPGDYVSVEAAISAINTLGVGTGGVRFLIAPGYTETVSNLLIKGDTLRTDSIVFEKAGPGTNPLITAAPGTGSMDAIIKISGTDYIVFDGIDLIDPLTNTNDTSRMEWGYAILKASETDGSQYVVIRNANITLQKANVKSVGIYAGNHTALSTTPFVVSQQSGAHSYISIHNNNISNVYSGISLTGNTSTQYRDDHNEIGVNGGNTITDFGGGADVSAIVTSGQKNIRISNNFILGGNNSTGNVNGILTLAAGSFGAFIDHNTISLTGITGGTASGINNYVGNGQLDTVQINNNTIRNSSTNGSYFYGINNNGLCYHLDISNDSVYDVTVSNGYGLLAGIYVNAAIVPFWNSRIHANAIFDLKWINGSGSIYGIGGLANSITIDSNHVYQLIQTGNSYGNTFGIYNSKYAPSDTVMVFGNHIHDFEHGYITAMSLNAGFNVISDNNIHHLNSGRPVLGLFIENKADIFRNRFYNFNYSSPWSDAEGLDVGVAAIKSTVTVQGAPIRIYYNLISNLTSPISENYNTYLDITAIILNGRQNADISYNTVYLDARSSSYNFGTAVIHNWLATLTVRNNVFVNTSDNQGEGYTMIHKGYTSDSYLGYQQASNNNLFYTGNATPRHLFLHNGYNNQLRINNFTAYKMYMGPSRDSLSFSEAVTFLDTAGSSPNFLKPDPTIATQIESGGAFLAGYNGDFISDTTRNIANYPLAAQINGGGKFPDAGAYEGDYTPADTVKFESATAIQLTGDAYRNVQKQGIIGVRVITSGVARPLNARSFTFTPGATTDTTDLTNARVYYTFSSPVFDTTVFFGNVIPTGTSYVINGNKQLLADTNYFWLAFDIRGEALPGSVIDATVTDVTLSSGTYIPDVLDPVGSKVIPTPLSGDYTVGTSGAYPTITLAVRDLNNKGINAPVSFTLLDNAYSAETFPLIINKVIGANAADTVLFRTSPGVSTQINGNASAIWLFNGASHVTIDGTGTGDSRNISIGNSSYNAPAIWLQNSESGDSSSYNTFNHLSVSSMIGIGIAGRTINNTNSRGRGHHYNRISNCTIGLNGMTTAIYTSGFSAAVKNTGTVIENNIISNAGILVQFEDSIRIINNSITQVTGSAYGISLGIPSFGTYTPAANEVTNAHVSRNTIGKVTPGYSAAVGIAVGSALSGVTTIDNNMIYDVLGNGTSAGQLTAGIFANTGNGSATKVYFNTVVLRGASAQNSPSSYALAVNGVDPVIDLKNNIFSNTLTSSSPSNRTYAIGFQSNTFTNISSNYNLYYTAGANAQFAAIGGVGSNTAGTVKVNLDSLRAYTLLDTNSFSTNPSFDTSTSFIPQVLQAVTGGLVLPGFETDIDGSLRSATTPSIGAREAPAVYDDMGVTAVVAENNELRVLVKNYGLNYISSFSIGYLLGNGSQVNNSFSVSLAPYDTITVIVPSFVIPNGISDLRVFSFLPNSTADSRATNDTFYSEVFYPLAGPYTIGGTTPDYADVTSAVNELNKRGISANVTFSIRSGIYYEHVEIAAVAGSSDSVTVTFTSEAANRDSVTISYAAIGTADNYIVKLNNTSNIRFEHIGFVTGSGNNSKIVNFTGRVTRCAFENCAFTGAIVNTAGSSAALIEGLEYYGGWNIIRNNIFRNGSYGLYLYGLIDDARSITAPDSMVIAGNIFRDVFYSNIYAFRNNNLKIQHNDINVPSGRTGSHFALNISNCNEALDISHNKIVLESPGTGLYMQACNGALGGGALISNNVISATDGTGIYMLSGGGWEDGNYHQRYYNNTVKVNSAYGNAAQFDVDNATWYYNIAVNIDVRNNVFANLGTGEAVHIPVIQPSVPLITFDHNNYYSAGAAPVRVATSSNSTFDSLFSVDRWKEYNLQDSNSVSFYPGFANTTTLVPDLNDSSVWSLNGRGTLIPSINTDVDGNPRPVSVQEGVMDIGAYQFTPNAQAPKAIAYPASAIAGDSQIFVSLFDKRDTVARIFWINSGDPVPSNVAVRQYTGEKHSFVGSTQAFSYVYTTVDMNASQTGSYNYDVNFRYKKEWIGTVPNETDMRATSKTPWATTWLLYTATPDTVGNIINTSFNQYDTALIFTITDINNPLPVNLLRFAATRTGKDVVVNWITASETNSSKFEVERSYNGTSFEKITTVQAAGNSSTTRKYQFNDRDAKTDRTIYYRLRSVDKDGSFAYSETRIVNPVQATQEHQIDVYPNPFTDQLGIAFETKQAGYVNITLTDITGKVIMQHSAATNAGTNMIYVDGTTLDAGVYFMSAKINGTTITKKVIRN